MACCTNCGLPTGNSHRMHDDLKGCLAASKDAIQQLARYRLLEGDEEKMSDQLRQNTLEIAIKVHGSEVSKAVSDTEKE